MDSNKVKDIWFFNPHNRNAKELHSFKSNNVKLITHIQLSATRAHTWSRDSSLISSGSLSTEKSARLNNVNFHTWGDATEHKQMPAAWVYFWLSCRLDVSQCCLSRLIEWCKHAHALPSKFSKAQWATQAFCGNVAHLPPALKAGRSFQGMWALKSMEDVWRQEEVCRINAFYKASAFPVTSYPPELWWLNEIYLFL